MPIAKRWTCPACGVPWCNGDHTTDTHPPLAARIAAVQGVRFQKQVIGSKGTPYTVSWSEEVGWRCTCKGFEYNHKCKHINQSITELIRASQQ